VQLRFGDGELGRQPDAGSLLSARYRVGLGAAGNVGAEAISRIVISGLTLDGVSFSISNPLPAQGGTEPEPIVQAKLFAPLAFRKELLRAITADDYAAIAARNPELQGAQAALVWTGSWYEADVALDPWRRNASAAQLVGAVEAALYKLRRMGHDLRVQPALYVPIALRLEVCARPGYDRGHVEAALLERFVGVPGGFFDSDQLSFGQSVHLSRIVAAAMSVAGVMSVTVTEFHRYGQASNHEIENGVLPLAGHEIAELANDPNHPERGFIEIDVQGGM
jgi:predicted phage baseplate assembly protein